MQTVALSGDAAISVRANVFPAAASTAADVSVVDQSGDVATAVQEIIARASARLDVSEAISSSPVEGEWVVQTTSHTWRRLLIL